MNLVRVYRADNQYSEWVTGSMDRMSSLTGFQRDLLFVIAGMQGPNGLEIKDELETDYGEEIRHGRLYPNLDTLVEEGLVEKGQYDRRTNKYLLTDDGKKLLSQRLNWQAEYYQVEAELDLVA